MANLSEEGIQKGAVATLGVMMIISFSGFLSQTMLTTALSPIMADFEVTAGEVQWLSTAYSLVLAVMVAPTAFLTRRFDTKKMLAFFTASFVAGSGLGYIAPTFWTLVGARLLQAFGVGILASLVQTTVFRVLPENKQGTGMAVTGFSMCVAPMLGPTVGGFLSEGFGWRSIFLLSLALGLVCLILCLAFVDTVGEHDSSARLDALSFLLSAFMMTGLLVGISNMASFGIASMAVWAPVAISILCGIGFFRRQRKLDEPLLRLDPFAIKDFNIGTAALLLLSFVLNGIVVVLPVFMQTTCGYGADVAGLIVLPATICIAVFHLFAARMAKELGNRTVFVSGCAILLVSTLMCMTFDANVGVFELAFSQLLRGIGLGLTTQQFATYALASARDCLEDASAFSAMGRNIGQALGSSVLAVVMTMVAGGAVDQSGQSVFAFHVACGVCAVVSVVCIAISLFCVDHQEPPVLSVGVPVSKLMFEPRAVLFQDATVRDALELFVREDLNGAPVVDATGRPVAFISDGDILRRISDKKNYVLDPASLLVIAMNRSGSIDGEFSKLLNTDVMQLAASPAYCVSASDDIAKASHVMGERRFQSLPVVEEGKLVGVLRRRDIVMLAVKSLVSAGER